MAIIPNLVKKGMLVSANSLIASTGMITTLVGTLIAGFLIKFIGPYPSFFVDTLTFLISALMIAKISIELTSKKKQKILGYNLFKDIKNGLSFINRHQLILRIVQLNAFFSFVSSFFIYQY